MGRQAPEPTHAWMHNPETDGYWQCPVALVDLYEERGWERCDAPPEDNSEYYDDPEDPRLQVAVEPGELDVDPDEEDHPEDDPDEPGDPNHNTTEEQ